MFRLKHFVLLSALFLTVHSSELIDDCPCRDEMTKDMKYFYDFLHKIPKEHDLDEYPIVPGELSPYVCNCMPKDRQKRMINGIPEPRRPRCPYGYREIKGLNVCFKVASLKIKKMESETKS